MLLFSVLIIFIVQFIPIYQRNTIKWKKTKKNKKQKNEPNKSKNMIKENFEKKLSPKILC